jgi:hypothetical protein
MSFLHFMSELYGSFAQLFCVYLSLWTLQTNQYHRSAKLKKDPDYFAVQQKPIKAHVLLQDDDAILWPKF